MTLRLAPDLELPDDLATQGVAIIGVRGSGKSNTEVRFAELLHAAGIPFVAVDPKGDWYGIRMNGTGPGLPIPVFGGLYGDFPLDEHTGARIADLLVEENLSAVLDVSRLSKAALSRFLTAFCNQLKARHQEEPHVRCVILEEAHRYIPQVVSGRPAADLKEAAASLLLEGRAFGLGCWACTQRPARLHNDVLEEVDTAVIHRIGVTATADLGRVRKWVQHEDIGAEVSESLTKLRNGGAWILSPTALGIVQRVQVDRRTTFDSGAAPLVGATRRELATMATIDAGAIKEALADTIEKAKADDPKTLRARIRELEHELAAVPPAAEPERIVEIVDVPLLDEALVERVEIAIAELCALGEHFTERADVLVENLGAARMLHDAARGNFPPTPPSGTRAARAPHQTAPAPAERRPRVPVVASESPVPASGITGGAKRMLEVLASYVGGLTEAQVATLAKLKRSGGTFGTYLSRLRTAGYVERYGNLLRITDAGLDAAGGRRPPVDPEETRAHWRSTLTGGAKRMFDLLVDMYPQGLDRDELAQQAGIVQTGGTFGTYLSRLRSNGLIEDLGDGHQRAHPDLFPEGLR